MLLLLMNLDFAAGEVHAPPPPPPINDQSGDGFRLSEAYKDEQKIQEKLRKRILDDDDEIYLIIQLAMKFLN